MADGDIIKLYSSILNSNNFETNIDNPCDDINPSINPLINERIPTIIVSIINIFEIFDFPIPKVI
ncbi:hypothetical protein CNEONATC25_02010 [Clostridium neonatale]|nr:hypothetical protein CNEONATC25_02010 [Clostridium neonatale]